MTLKQLTYFIKISETGNLTKAAEALNMSQPPLSYQLKLLEDELGVNLFTRESHAMRITEEGLYLHNKAIQILSLVDRTINEISNLADGRSFQINIGTVTSSGHNFLPKTIKRFKQMNPAANFNIYDGSSIRLQELLQNNVIDIAILREPFPKDMYEHMLLPSSNLNKNYDNDYFVAVGIEDYFDSLDTDDDTIDFAQVLKMPLIVHRRFEDLLNNQARLVSLEVENLCCLNDNISSSIGWATNGLGVAIMPFTSSLLIKDDDKLLVKRIVNPSFYSNMYIVWNKNITLSRHTEAFIEICKDYQFEMDQLIN